MHAYLRHIILFFFFLRFLRSFLFLHHLLPKEFGLLCLAPKDITCHKVLLGFTFSLFRTSFNFWCFASSTLTKNERTKAQHTHTHSLSLSLSLYVCVSLCVCVCVCVCVWHSKQKQNKRYSLWWKLLPAKPWLKRKALHLKVKNLNSINILFGFPRNLVSLRVVCLPYLSRTDQLMMILLLSLLLLNRDR